MWGGFDGVEGELVGLRMLVAGVLGRRVGCGLVNVREKLIEIGWGRGKAHINLNQRVSNVRWGVLGGTAFVVGCFERVEFMWWVMKPINVNSSNQHRNNPISLTRFPLLKNTNLVATVLPAPDS